MPTMLTRLHISNIVLIDRLNLEFGRGLNVLTGETGAGKSILMDALALALGARSDAGLVRRGADAAQVVAEFEMAKPRPGAELFSILTEYGIGSEDTVILRRTLGADGKSKAWANDVPVSVKALKSIGDALVEIHGQFESHSLLDPATHGAALDEFAGNNRSFNELLNKVNNAYKELRDAEKKLRELRELLEKSAAERDFLEHNVRELELLKPMPGEEETLSARRAAMMDAEKNAGILADAKAALSGAGRGIGESIFSAAHILERVKTEPNPYQSQIDRLYEAGGAIAEVEEQIAPAALETSDLERTEERLFALRAAARKHRVAADQLSEKLKQMQEQLGSLEDSDASLTKLESEAAEKKSRFDKLAAEIRQERIAASDRLRKEILGELPALKLGNADFSVEIKDAIPNSSGADEITFLIRTNPGTDFAPLHKIASGGELSRLMLALRVVLTHGDAEKTFVFDEVDAGISGATAAAVGERLSKLAAKGQAIVITHSAQVAGHADAHFLITKTSTDADTTTSVAAISGEARLSELARIISGKKITGESIKVAKTLLKK